MNETGIEIQGKRRENQGPWKELKILLFQFLWALENKGQIAAPRLNGNSVGRVRSDGNFKTVHWFGTKAVFSRAHKCPFASLRVPAQLWIVA